MGSRTRKVMLVSEVRPASVGIHSGSSAAPLFPKPPCAPRTEINRFFFFFFFFLDTRHGSALGAPGHSLALHLGMGKPL